LKVVAAVPVTVARYVLGLLMAVVQGQVVLLKCKQVHRQLAILVRFH
jgi:hypothetical protein